MNRADALRRFYDLLDELRHRTGGPFRLEQCNGRLPWPARGVYFFFEAGENRSDTGEGQRVVRVGTHAINGQSRTKLWTRLAQHAGSRASGGGNHRCSIFRLLTGEALKVRSRSDGPRSWGVKGDLGKAAQGIGSGKEEQRKAEGALERAVSAHIRQMPFLLANADTEHDGRQMRAIIEKGAIALLSNFRRAPLDPASAEWLGKSSGRDRVRESGLWNNNHVDEQWNSEFLEILARAIEETDGITISGA